jgi:hypothetical protein
MTFPPLAEMMAEAAAFRGELTVSEDRAVSRIRAAATLLGYGSTEEDAASELMANGATPEEAYLAVKAGKTL